MELHIINQSTNLPGGLNVKWKHRVHLLSAVLSADFILLAYLICLLAAPVTVREASAPEGTFEPEKYLALTFDDDVIIGLSQEISYKEVVSMI
jgi:hypothetical protein